MVATIGDKAGDTQCHGRARWWRQVYSALSRPQSEPVHSGLIGATRPPSHFSGGARSSPNVPSRLSPPFYAFFSPLLSSLSLLSGSAIRYSAKRVLTKVRKVSSSISSDVGYFSFKVLRALP